MSLIEVLVLRLKKNKLSEIPTNIRILTNLQYLNLSRNSINRLPSLSSLTQLTYLNLSGNSFKSLPNLSYLRFFYLQSLLTREQKCVHFKTKQK